MENLSQAMNLGLLTMVLVRFGGISGEFGPAMVRILARLMVFTFTVPKSRPSDHDMVAILGQ